MMKVKHGSHTHTVTLLDYGIMDTVFRIDGVEVRYSDVSRNPSSGAVWRRAFIEAAIDCFNDGVLMESE